MSENIKVARVSGWRRFFTLTYWQMQWRFLGAHGRTLNVVEVFKIEMPEEAFPESVRKLLKDAESE